MPCFSEDMSLVLGLVKKWEEDAPVSEDSWFKDLGRVEFSLKIIDSALDALAVLHNEGILHLDLNAANLIWAMKGAKKEDNGTAYLSDFGCAVRMSKGKYVPDNYNSRSMGYAAPELSRGGELTAKTDLFSIGAILFLLCVGKRATVDWKLTDISYFNCRPIKREIDDLQIPLSLKNKLKEVLVNTCAAKARDRKYCSVQELQKEIKELKALCVLPGYRMLCHAPDPIAGFIGRSEEILRLEKLIDENQMVFITGVGGLGKSELILQAAKRLSTRYSFYQTMFSDSMEKTIEEISVEDLPEARSKDEKLVDLKFKCLQRHGNNDVLIIDSCDITKQQLYAEPIFQRMKKLNLKLVFTTRYRYEDMPNLELEPFSRDYAIKLFSKYNGNLYEKTDLYKLVDAVNCHTLSIMVIAKMLKQCHGSLKIENVLQVLKDKTYDSLNREKVSLNYHEKYEMYTYEEILEKIFDMVVISNEGKQLLYFITKIPDEGISTEWFSKTFTPRENQIIENELFACGWIQKKDDYILMHPLVNFVIRRQMKCSLDSMIFYTKKFIKAYEKIGKYSEKGRDILHTVVDAVADLFYVPEEQERFYVQMCEESLIYYHAYCWKMADKLAKQEKILKPRLETNVKEYLLTALRIANELWVDDQLDLAMQYRDAGKILCDLYWYGFEEDDVQQEGIMCLHKAFSILINTLEYWTRSYIVRRLAFEIAEAISVMGRKSEAISFLLYTKELYEDTLSDGLYMGHYQYLAELSLEIATILKEKSKFEDALIYYFDAAKYYMETLKISGSESVKHHGITAILAGVSSEGKVLVPEWNTEILERVLEYNNDLEDFLFHLLLAEGYKRQDYFEGRKKKIIEHLKSAVNICKQYLAENSVLIAKLYILMIPYLGKKERTVYTRLILDIFRCNYNKDKCAEQLILAGRNLWYCGSCGKSLIEEALGIYEQYLPENDIRLANLYEELGKIEKALKLYEKHQSTFLLKYRPEYRPTRGLWEDYFPMKKTFLAKLYYDNAKAIKLKKGVDFAERAVSLLKEEENQQVIISKDIILYAYKRYAYLCAITRQELRLKVLIEEFLMEYHDEEELACFYHEIFEGYSAVDSFRNARENGYLALEKYNAVGVSEQMAESMIKLFERLAYIEACCGKEEATQNYLKNAKQLIDQYSHDEYVENRYKELYFTYNGLLNIAKGNYKEAVEYYRKIEENGPIFEFLIRVFCLFGPIWSFFNRRK